MRVLGRTMAAFVVFAILLLLVACSKPAEESAPDPKIAPPLIAEAGVLRAGVDLRYPPFAGRDKDVEAGIDIDVASALAAQLGLELKTVQVDPGEAAAALQAGRVDIVMSAPLDKQVVSGARIAGTYINDGPAFFVRSTEQTGPASSGTDEAGKGDTAAEAKESANVAKQIPVSLFAGKRIGAQEGSPSFWALEYDLGEGAVVPFKTLRAAFEALAAGEIDVVAGNAMVSAYLARDFSDITFAGQYGPATALGVAVSPDNDGLNEAIRDALDELASGGALETIRATWVGDLPTLVLPGSDERQ